MVCCVGTHLHLPGVGSAARVPGRLTAALSRPDGAGTPLTLHPKGSPARPGSRSMQPQTASYPSQLSGILSSLSAYPPDVVFLSKTSSGRRGGEGGARARSGPKAAPLRRQSRPRQPISSHSRHPFFHSGRDGSFMRDRPPARPMSCQSSGFGLTRFSRRPEASGSQARAGLMRFSSASARRSSP